MNWYTKKNSKYAKIRPLGKTGWELPLFSLGGQSILESPNEKDKTKAIEIIQKFINLGGKYIDTSPIYSERERERQSEKNIGNAIKNIKRDKFYLTTKTEERYKEAAWKDVNKSLETLGTEPDCIQVHHLDTKKEVDQVFSKNGAMHSLIRAKKEGLIKFIGVTGHSDPDVLLYALEKYPFDTVLGAINPADAFMGKTSFQKELIPYCYENGIGFIGMKLCSRGALFSPGGIKSMQDTLYYSWSLPISTTIVGINTIEQLQHNFELANNFKKLTASEQKAIENQVNQKYLNHIMFFNQKGDSDLWSYYGDGKKTPFFTI